jgi:pilus assembly protein TadC
MLLNALIVAAAALAGLAVWWLLSASRPASLFSVTPGEEFPNYPGVLGRLLGNVTQWRFVHRSAMRDAKLAALLPLADSAYTPLQLRTLQVFWAMALGVVGAALGLTAGLALSGTIDPQALFLSVILGLLFAAAGYRRPMWQVKSAVMDRTAAVSKQMVTVLQLLRMASESGQMPQQGLASIVTFLPEGAARDEIARLNRAVTAGTPFEDAITEFARRNDSRDVRSVARTLSDIVRDGQPRHDILAAKTTEMRQNRMVAATETAQKNQAKVMVAILVTSMVTIALPFFVTIAPDFQGLTVGG